MKTDDIVPIQQTGGNNHKTHALKAPMPFPPESGHTTVTSSDTVSKSALDHVEINKIDTSNILAQDISIMIRSVNHDMETIERHLDTMKSSLEAIVKIYPPYPPGSSERIEALRQFTALRNMIDKIAQPHPEIGMHRILGDPAKDGVSGDWTMQTNGPSENLVIHHQPVHAGKNGLNLPELNPDTKDNLIIQAIERIATAIDTLIAKRQIFTKEANQVISKM